jgi:hypothetical protein
MKNLLLVIILNFISNSIDAQTIWTNTAKLKGTIGTYEIAMTLAVPYGGATPCFTIGEYYYLSKKKIIDLCSDDDVKIIERVNGKSTGYFVLNNWDKRVGQTVLGKWYTMDGKKSYPVSLKVISRE